MDVLQLDDRVRIVVQRDMSEMVRNQGASMSPMSRCTAQHTRDVYKTGMCTGEELV